MVSKSHHNSTTGSRYESFQDEIDEDYNSFAGSAASPSSETITARMTSSSGMELLGNGLISGGRDSGSPQIRIPSPSSTSSNTPQQPKRIRLRAVESEREYFLKLMNVDLFRKLVMVQSAASLVIVIAQVVLYAIVTRQTYKAVDYVGVGIWGPVVFFFTACWLTWITTRSPSGCSIGTAMGFQIASIFVGIILLIFATIALVQHGQYSYWGGPGPDYDPEITGRVFCSFMILGAVCETVAALITSIQFCRLTCCARSNAHETIVFDVETVKV